MTVFCQFALRGMERPEGFRYPLTTLMNYCQRELEQRGLPIPLVDPFEGQQETPEPLDSVRAIHQALNGNPPKDVYCAVTSPYERPFIYQVFEARTRSGVLEVRTINRWEVPLIVYALPGQFQRLIERS